MAYRASTGERLWRGHYPFGRDVVLTDVEDIVVSADGERVVTSVSLLAPTARMAAVAFDAGSGRPEWLWTYPKKSTATGLAAGVGKIFLSGYAGPNKGRDRVVVALRAPTGRLAWKRVAHATAGSAIAEGLRFDGGGLFVTGGVETETGWTVRTNAYEARDGAGRWADTLHGLSSADVVGVSQDGATVVIAGVRYGETAVDRWGAVTYDAATGARGSVMKVDPKWAGQVFAMAADADATTVFFAGTREGGANDDAAVGALDIATGGTDWTSFFDGGGNDGVIGLVASPTAPRLFAAAYVDVGGTYAWRTLGYDTTTGDELWSDVYTGPLDEQGFPRAITIGADGARVYVGGYTSTLHSDDFVTIAYTAA